MDDAAHTAPDGSLVMLSVEGMTCESCVDRVAKALMAVGGEDVRVDLDAGMAEVRLPGGVPVESATSAVRKAGYTAVPR